MKLNTKGGMLTISIAGSFFSVSAVAADCINGENFNGTCTIPANVTSLSIDAWGGGGAGSQRGGNGPEGTGGNGGSYCASTFNVTPGATMNVVIGTGGTVGPLTVGLGAPGNPGNPSSVTGVGIAGLTAEGGFGGASGFPASVGSIVMCSAPNAIKWAGGSGGIGGSNEAGGGGGSATPTAAGENGDSGVPPQTGAGGTGTGAGGNGGQFGYSGGPGLQIALPGQSGGFPGGGGGGGTFQVGIGPTHLITAGDGGDGMVRMSFKAVIPEISSPAKPVPTISDWALASLFSLLAIFGVARLRKRDLLHKSN